MANKSEETILVCFGAYVSYGKMDSSNYDIYVLLTESEYERLKVSCETHWRMRDDEEIADIYEKAYNEALSVDLEQMRSDKKMLADKMAWYLNISYEEALKQKYEDDLIIEMLESEGERGISYPEELEYARDFED